MLAAALAVADEAAEVAIPTCCRYHVLRYVSAAAVVITSRNRHLMFLILLQLRHTLPPLLMAMTMFSSLMTTTMKKRIAVSRQVTTAPTTSIRPTSTSAPLV